jgi:hypothetical protein
MKTRTLSQALHGRGSDRFVLFRTEEVDLVVPALRSKHMMPPSPEKPVAIRPITITQGSASGQKTSSKSGTNTIPDTSPLTQDRRWLAHDLCECWDGDAKQWFKARIWKVQSDYSSLTVRYPTGILRPLYLLDPFTDKDSFTRVLKRQFSTHLRPTPCDDSDFEDPGRDFTDVQKGFSDGRHTQCPRCGDVLIADTHYFDVGRLVLKKLSTWCVSCHGSGDVQKLVVNAYEKVCEEVTALVHAWIVCEGVVLQHPSQQDLTVCPIGLPSGPWPKFMLLTYSQDCHWNETGIVITHGSDSWDQVSVVHLNTVPVDHRSDQRSLLDVILATKMPITSWPPSQAANEVWNVLQEIRQNTNPFTLFDTGVQVYPCPSTWMAVWVLQYLPVGCVPWNHLMDHVDDDTAVPWTLQNSRGSSLEDSWFTLRSTLYAVYASLSQESVSVQVLSESPVEWFCCVRLMWPCNTKVDLDRICI